MTMAISDTNMMLMLESKDATAGLLLTSPQRPEEGADAVQCWAAAEPGSAWAVAGTRH